MLITVECTATGDHDERVPVRDERAALRYARRMAKLWRAKVIKLWFLLPDGTKADARNADMYVYPE